MRGQHPLPSDHQETTTQNITVTGV